MGPRGSLSIAGHFANDLSPNFLAQDLAHLIARQGRDTDIMEAALEPTEFFYECGNQGFRIDRFRSFEDNIDLFLAPVVLHRKQADAFAARYAHRIA